MQVLLPRREFLRTGGATLLLAVMPVMPVVPATAGGAVLRHRLRFVYSITNPQGDTVAGGRLYCSLPMTEKRGQQLEALDISADFRRHEDAAGNAVAAVVLPTLAPYATALVTIAMTVAVPVDSTQVRRPRAELWLGVEKYAESDAPEIVRVAERLRYDDARATARAIHDWLRANIRDGGYVAEDRGALDALQRGSADCTEYAWLAIALARACGIPARMIGGYVYPGDAIPQAGDYHNWAELYVDGRWLVLDAQKDRFDERPGEYIAFERVTSRVKGLLQGAHRFRVEGGGLVARLGS